jgi:glycosyltransferase involved in cell wall biosynthesis
MKKVIVTTTINPVTEALRRFQQMQDWELVVVGDLKTPKDYASQLERGIYITPEMQEARDKELSDAIGWNCIQRRNFGLLWAHDLGADIVAVVDDDNIPYPFWGKNLYVGKEIEVNYYETDLPAFDPVGATNYPHLWHRGYPLQLLPKRNYTNKSRRKITVDVQADFWNGDPDIDAICRMEHAPDCTFDDNYFPISSNKLAPFNSQNTFISGKWLKDYFLFPHIGRMDDIWAAYYVQAKGCHVVFSKASVFQARNPHDLVRDMKAEYLGYENNLKIVEELPKDPEKIFNFLPGRAIYAFKCYQRHFK